MGTLQDFVERKALNPISETGEESMSAIPLACIWRHFERAVFFQAVQSSLVALGIHQIQDSIPAEWRIKWLGRGPGRGRTFGHGKPNCGVKPFNGELPRAWHGRKIHGEGTSGRSINQVLCARGRSLRQAVLGRGQ